MTDNQQAQVNINKDTNASLNSSPNTNTSYNHNTQANSSYMHTQTPIDDGLTQDSKNMALLNWLGCLFFGFIPPLIIFLVKKDDAYVQSQAREALNWSITFIITYIGLWIVSMILGFILAFIWAPLAFIPFLLLILYGFSHLVFCIMGAIQCSAGKDFRVPFNIRLIK